MSDTVVCSFWIPLHSKEDRGLQNLMAKQYGLKREEKAQNTKTTTKPVAVAFGSTQGPDRRAADRGHAGQLLWSFAVAICLILAALLQWTAPKNALLDQDRSPAQIRFETVNTSLNGS